MNSGGPHIVIAGAGAIGCFVGGLWAAAGARVTLLGRARILDPVVENGLRLTDYARLDRHVAAGDLMFDNNPACFDSADIIVVCVKTAATADMAHDIARRARPGTPVLSFQNGMENAATLRAALPGHDVRAAMVPFNVVAKGPAHWHRATSGDVVIEGGAGHLAQTLTTPHLKVIHSDDITAVQWGKLLVNLNNAPNALSGLTLHNQLMDRDWRRLMADQMAEALAVLQAHNIKVTPTTPVPATWIPHILRLPTPLFRRIAASMLTIDPAARTSMAYDLEAGHPTEIDALQGRILDMARAKGIAAPLCQAMSDAINAGDRDLKPDMLRTAAKGHR